MLCSAMPNHTLGHIDVSTKAGGGSELRWAFAKASGARGHEVFAGNLHEHVDDIKELIELIGHIGLLGITGHTGLIELAHTATRSHRAHRAHSVHRARRAHRQAL